MRLRRAGAGPGAPVAHAAGGSEPFEPRNLLDRLTPAARLEGHYAYVLERERQLLGRLESPAGGDVLSVGAPAGTRVGTCSRRRRSGSPRSTRCPTGWSRCWRGGSRITG